MDIDFLGAADGVTGSRHAVTIGGQRVLLDCGMFQGFKTHRERNWLPPPEAMRDLDAVVLSHAHLDHSGWLPVLVRHGWRGPVFTSAATADLAQVLLLDAAHLQEEDARRAKRQGWSRHARPLPLFTRADAQRALALLRPLPPGRTQALGGVTLTLTPAGHLLGACSVHLAARHESLLFSGDLGRQDDLLMPAPQVPPPADVLLVESTYGNRLHPHEDTAERLAALITDTAARGGHVLMPTFAVGRAQALLIVLQRLKADGRIPDLPVFLDSPMAIEASALYRRHGRLLRLNARELRGLHEGVRVVADGSASLALSRGRMPAVILSASGMATGGRVLNHLKAMLPDPRHTVVFAGFQVGGSRGALLVGGATSVKIHGAQVPVRAAVTQLEGFSGHADQDGLMRWLAALPRAPRQTFVVHGDPDASDALRRRIQDDLRWPVRVPEHGEHASA